MLHGRAIVYLRRCADCEFVTEDRAIAVKLTNLRCKNLHSYRLLTAANMVKGSGGHAYGRIKGADSVCYSALRRDQGISAWLSQLPVSSDCAFGPNRPLRVQSLHLPGWGLARHRLSPCFSLRFTCPGLFAGAVFLCPALPRPYRTLTVSFAFKEHGRLNAISSSHQALATG